MELLLVSNDRQESRTHNSGLAKGGVSCFVETFVQARSFVLRINFSAKNPALRQAANRYVQAALNIQTIMIILTKNT